MASPRVMVTGANKGIGLAIVRQLVDRGCFVFLGSRSPERGAAAKASLKDSGNVEVVQIDVTDQASVDAAAAAVKAKCAADGSTLHALVNNAGLAKSFGYDNHADHEETLCVNWHGVVRVTNAFLPLLSGGGRVVMIGSGAGPSFVAKCTADRKRFFLNPAITVGDIEELVAQISAASAKHAAAGTSPVADFEALGVAGSGSYGLSKACVSAYAMHLARAHPHLVVNSCTPGFIETDLTRPFADAQGADYREFGLLPVDKGAVCPVKLTLDPLAVPSGEAWFFGSDSERSPFHKYRSPYKEPPFDGVLEADL
eukprot:CAMPEP_0182916336 /NCGR_PEP_ID=MMETSP0105_2-20130417/874_1 /TAXON_ID=81532 ORGANISM="Acanthoeca-like sp., Strain 10tr" /NCGR_SAMPLE_ID=MMETSP0105_2 /ASSEMBLY_ACC=CAM_ASM_000205 /LENGTH=311 /DNA_ID=CAMNT_0025053277 /DNA_START=21 /DNA_END=956 /DNA_ORIENTATION=-